MLCLLQLEDEIGPQIKIEGKPAVLQKFSKQCQVCLRMFYNESKYEEDQEEHSKLIDLSGSMNCPSCYVKVAKLEINQHYLDDHPELKSACCLHCEGKMTRIMKSRDSLNSGYDNECVQYIYIITIF